MNKAAAVVRTTRIIHSAMIVISLLYVYVAEKLNRARPPKQITVFYAVVAGLAIMLLVVIFGFRARFITQSEEILQSDPENTAALARWRMGYIVGFALSLAVVLYGLVVRFTGGTGMQAFPFYATGIASIVILTPRNPCS